MARPNRVELEGAVYHVMARGNERKRIYRDDADRSKFLETLAVAVQDHGLRIHGYCLMPNHYHLLAETPRGNLSRAVGWLQTTYSIRFNRRYRRSAHLFQGRFKAHLVEADGYAMALLRYVHLNPVRPGNKTAPIPAERRGTLAGQLWSSHLAYAGRKPAPAWLCTDWLGFFAPNRKEARQRYRRFVDEAFAKAIESPWDNLRLGLALGGEEMMERVRRLLKAKPHQEEVRWMTRIECATERIAAAQTLAQEQSERAWQVWVRVHLGAERRIDVARVYGYKDGSAITQILTQLETAAQHQPAMEARMLRLQRAFANAVSSIKS